MFLHSPCSPLPTFPFPATTCVRSEGDALLGDLVPVRQREHLEAARVGEDRPVTAREAVQSAVCLDHLQPRPQVQVEGVAEADFGAQRAHLVGQHALRSEEHTSEIQSLMRNSNAVFCMKNKTN